MISVCFHGKPFNIKGIQAYTLTSNAEEAEVEWLYGELQDLLELTPKKDVLFFIGDWNAKVGSQEILGVTGKLEFCEENALVIGSHEQILKLCQSDLFSIIHKYL